MRDIPRYGYRKPFKIRFNCLLGKRIHGQIYLARLFEAGIIENLVVIDSRMWPSLSYDSWDPYPLVLSSSALFQQGDPDASKSKLFNFMKFSVTVEQEKIEKNLKSQHVSMPGVVIRQKYTGSQRKQIFDFQFSTSFGILARRVHRVSITKFIALVVI